MLLYKDKMFTTHIAIFHANSRYLNKQPIKLKSKMLNLECKLCFIEQIRTSDFKYIIFQILVLFNSNNYKQIRDIV